MRIISKDSDYYDGYADYNRKDRFNKVWVRNRSEVKINKRFLRDFEDKIKYISIYNNDFDVNPVFIIIAGEVYPIIEITPYDTYEEEYFFNIHDLKERYPRAVTRGYLNREARINEFFNFNYKDMTDVCLEIESPIFLIRPTLTYYKERYSSLRHAVKNINLKGYGFSKIFDAPQMYQMLNHFVSNVMVNDEMPETEQEDIDKVQAHGFDTKWSFRKKGNK